MNIRIAFRHMEHTPALEAHAHRELAKLEKLINTDRTPIFIDLVMEEHKLHAHNRVELRINLPNGHFMAHAEGADMYLVTTQVVDKMVAELRKEKERRLDKRDHPADSVEENRKLKGDFEK